MATIKCLIIDDEKGAIDILKHHVDKVPFLELVGSTTSSIEGIDLINQSKIDLVFLDVQMPVMTGIQFVEAMQGRCKIIFTTAYPEFAINGYELDIVDYLLKPISLPRFVKAAQKAKDLLDSSATVNTGLEIKDNHFFVQADTKGKLVKINLSDVDYIESLRNFVQIHSGAKRTIVYISLKELENALPKPAFLRIHKSFIISTSKIVSVDSRSVLLQGVDDPIPFGDIYKNEILQIIKGRTLN